MILIASLGKTQGNHQMGNKAKMAMLGKQVGREREIGGGASQARKARRTGGKRQKRARGKEEMAMEEEDKVVWSHQEEGEEKKVRGLGGVDLKG